jgi:hypothetical protein
VPIGEWDTNGGTMTQDSGAVQRGALDALVAAKRDLSERLLRPSNRSGFRAFAAVGPSPTDNVVGIGIGEKLTDGKATGEPALKLFVRVKYDRGELDSNQVLPREHLGVPTDVEEIGLVKPLVTAPTVVPQVAAINPRTRMRPAHPGSSVGFQDPNNQFTMAGTFGALVHDTHGQYILSNNHVLADEGRLAPGAPIFQPGLLDGGRPANDKIAELTRFIALQAGPNTVDCAIARVLRQADVSNAILRIGIPQGVAAAQIDMVVHKFGRTSSYTVGRVISVDTDVTVGYETGNFLFHGQIIIQSTTTRPFSRAGDSGSLIVVRQTRAAIGLLFAGSATHTIANHIDAVLAAMQVSLV